MIVSALCQRAGRFSKREVSKSIYLVKGWGLAQTKGREEREKEEFG
jgi:hypothetical protein